MTVSTIAGGATALGATFMGYQSVKATQNAIAGKTSNTNFQKGLNQIAGQAENKTAVTARQALEAGVMGVGALGLGAAAVGNLNSDYDILGLNFTAGADQAVNDFASSAWTTVSDAVSSAYNAVFGGEVEVAADTSSASEAAATWTQWAGEMFNEGLEIGGDVAVSAGKFISDYSNELGIGLGSVAVLASSYGIYKYCSSPAAPKSPLK